MLEEKLDILRGMLHLFDYSGFLTGGHSILAKTASHVLGIKDGKKRFGDTALAMLEGEIRTRFATNVVQQVKFSDLLSDVIKRYQNRAIETAQVIEMLIEMAKKFKEAIGRGEELGLNADELAFYDALANNEEAVRENVRASLRLLVKRILRKYKYPPDQQEIAVQLVLDQAETLSAEWAA